MEQLEHPVARIEEAQQKGKRYQGSFHRIHILAFLLQVDDDGNGSNDVYHSKKYDKSTDHLLKIECRKHDIFLLFSAKILYNLLFHNRKMNGLNSTLKK